MLQLVLKMTSKTSLQQQGYILNHVTKSDSIQH